MFRVYARTNGQTTIIDEYGEFDPEYALKDSQVIQEANKSGSFEFKIYPGHPYYNQIKKLRTKIWVIEDDVCVFYGRVLYAQLDTDRSKRVYCEGALSFLTDSVVSTETAYAIQVLLAATDPQSEWHVDPNLLSGNIDVSCVDFLKILVYLHNSQVEEDKQFHIGTMSAVSSSEKFKFELSGTGSIADTLIQKLVEEVGGYIRVRPAFQNGNWETPSTLYIDWMDKLEPENMQSVEYAKNLITINYDESGVELFSILLPTGKPSSGSGSTEYHLSNIVDMTEEQRNPTVIIDGVEYHLTISGNLILIQEAIDLYGKVIKPIDISNINAANTLYDRSLDYIKRNFQAFPEEVTVTALDLAKLDEYTAPIRYGGMVRVVSNPHNIERTMMCCRAERKLRSPQENSYKLTTKLNEKGDGVPIFAKDTTRKGSSGGGSGSGYSGGGGISSNVGDNTRDIKKNADAIEIAYKTLELKSKITDGGVTYSSSVKSVAAGLLAAYERFGFPPGISEEIRNRYEQSENAGLNIGMTADEVLIQSSWYEPETDTTGFAAFSSTNSYATGDKVSYTGADGNTYLYEFTTAHAPGPWNRDQVRVVPKRDAQGNPIPKIYTMIDSSAEALKLAFNDDGTLESSEIDILRGQIYMNVNKPDGTTVEASLLQLLKDEINLQTTVTQDGTIQTSSLVKTSQDNVSLIATGAGVQYDPVTGKIVTDENGDPVFIDGTTQTLYSRINVEKDRISLVVTGSGRNAEVNRASIMLAINEDGETTAGVKANKILLDGRTYLSDSLTVNNGYFALNGNLYVGLSGENYIRATELRLVGASSSQGANVESLTASDISTMIVKAAVSGNTLQLWKKGDPSSTPSITFSKATTLSGDWVGGVLTVEALPQNEHYYSYLSAGTTTRNGNVYSVPVTQSTRQDGVYSTTGYTITLDASEVWQEGYDAGGGGAVVTPTIGATWGSGQQSGRLVVDSTPAAQAPLEYWFSSGTPTWSDNTATVPITTAPSQQGTATSRFNISVDASSRYSAGETAGQNAVAINKGTWDSGIISFTKSVGTSSTKTVQLSAGTPEWSGSAASVSILDGSNSTGYSVSVDVSSKLATKTITPTTSQQTVTPETGYIGFSSVTIEAASGSADDIHHIGLDSNMNHLGNYWNCVLYDSEDNVIRNVNTNGSSTGLVFPVGNKTITENGEYTARTDTSLTGIAAYNKVTVNVPTHNTKNNNCVNNVTLYKDEGQNTSITMYYYYQGERKTAGTGVWYKRNAEMTPRVMYT